MRCLTSSSRALDPARRLLLDALDRDKPHVRAAECGADRRRIAGIGLVAPDKRLHIGRRDQPHLVAERAQAAAPVMRRATRLDPDLRRRQLGKKPRHLAPPQALLNDDLPARILAVDLKHRLRDVEPDRDSLHRDGLRCWSFNRPQLGTSMPSGGRPPSIPSEAKQLRTDEI